MFFHSKKIVARRSHQKIKFMSGKEMIIKFIYLNYGARYKKIFLMTFATFHFLSHFLLNINLPTKLFFREDLARSSFIFGIFFGVYNLFGNFLNKLLFNFSSFSPPTNHEIPLFFSSLNFLYEKA